MIRESEYIKFLKRYKEINNLLRSNNTNLDLVNLLAEHKELNDIFSFEDYILMKKEDK